MAAIARAKAVWTCLFLRVLYRTKSAAAAAMMARLPATAPTAMPALAPAERHGQLDGIKAGAGLLAVAVVGEAVVLVALAREEYAAGDNVLAAEIRKQPDTMEPVGWPWLE
ncbi:hypothetical protein PWT90_10837 [Aphanocladium album]|nr:hypothetical protein PWT90_10837 [Aphanocladium album]